MDTHYFNHTATLAETWWSRRDFVRRWWRIYSRDAYWVPPPYATLRRALEPRLNPHLARLEPLLIYLDALPKGRGHYPSLDFEQPVAAAVVTCDPRRHDGACYLALPHLVNDVGSFDYLLETIAEALAPHGFWTIMGPAGLSPHLGSGVLLDRFNVLPPLHTPYNPPFLPELIGRSLNPIAESQLYYLETSTRLPKARAKLTPLEITRLAGDLLPLLAAACPEIARSAPPDRKEAAFILKWLETFPLSGWLAEVDGQPVGFVLLQGDYAPYLRRSRGGRGIAGSLRLRLARRQILRQGRLLFGAVLPEYQNQGVGTLLLTQALEAAREQGWEMLTVGPVPRDSPASHFLKRHGALGKQTYGLYQGGL